MSFNFINIAPLLKLAQISDVNVNSRDHTATGRSETRDKMASTIGARNKIDDAFKKAVRRGQSAVNGKCPEGNGCPPSIHEVLTDLIFEVTGDRRYSPKSRGAY